MDKRLLDFLDKLGTAGDLAGLQAVLDRFLTEIGLPVFTYATLRGMGSGKEERLVQSNYPLDWRAVYDAQGYELVDPTLRHCASSVLPTSWAELSARPDLDPTGRVVLQEARQFGLLHGVTIPVHGPDSFAIMSLAGSVSDREFHGEMPVWGPILHLASLHYHEHVGRLSGAGAREDTVTLTKRESEMLLWASRGKTAGETADILGMSENTVRQHIKAAMRKFGVVTKAQAVVRAVDLRLIHP